ncbi:tetratricopeptide repeat-containing protein [Ideonella sp.]|uniref:tetratricopeptide repeat-containing protein n=1 Tax=Ideonella sp. TaxID=1929293 RepID=UPI002B48AC66|nr:tetratricopeptide repeat-containing protein [Ideonella sp.]HJV69478.1 tetratricopeptide repeat-containing protein [Ideonella sp.]
MNTTPAKPLCFVVQGFGSKTDYTDGRVLDLDASYDVIKQAVEKAGLACVRADEIVHSGTIDIPMYQQLLAADLVIADLSTYNLNAAFELGVRYALRPRATIVVAESKFKSPFDVNHILIRRYEHLGPDLGAKEARRFEKELSSAIKAILADSQTDSPVYTLLPGLKPPQRPLAPPPSAAGAEPAAPAAGPRPRKAPTPPSARDWLERAQQAMAKEDYPAAVKAWAEVRRFSPADRHATQQLALATYRARRPSEKKALEEAHQLLLPLEPATTNDPETLSLWGAIHRRLWERGEGPAHLDQALLAFERGLSLAPDHYLAAQLATLRLAHAAQLARAGQAGESREDQVLAQRLWREAQAMAQAQAARKTLSPTARFWAHATLWEAAIALGDATDEKRWASRLATVESAGWMKPTRLAQGERLRAWRDELAAPRPARQPAQPTARKGRPP